MAFTYEDLTTPITLSEAEEELLDFISEQGIETTDWRTGSPELTIVKTLALIYKNLQNRAVQQVKNSVNETAQGEALTVLSKNVFDNERVLAQRTVGKFLLNGPITSELPISFKQAELKITDGNRIFQNTSPFTLSVANNSSSFDFEAELPGADYNISNNSFLSPLNTNIPVNVSNPAVSGSTSWITTMGSDEEDDETLRQRNATKWSELQVGSLTTDRVRSIAFSASSDITSVYVDDLNPRGQFTVDVYIAEDFTTGSVAQRQAVQQAFDVAFFGNSANNLVSASLSAPVDFNPSSIKVFYQPSLSLSFITEQVVSASNNWIKTIPIGGFNYTSTLTGSVSVIDLYDKILEVDGVVKVSGSTQDVFLAKNEKLTPPNYTTGSADWSVAISYEATSQ